MNFHAHYAGITEPVETCLVGSGGFGRSYLAQSRRITAGQCAHRGGHDGRGCGARLRGRRHSRHPRSPLCETRRAGAGRLGCRADASRPASLETVIDLPFQLLVEATGSPEAATRHSLAAIEAGRHVALVSKEADSVVGPGLARLARDKGVVVTPVDGDQPSLLIALASWAEVLGLEIIAAGKSSEYDFVLDAATGAVTCNGVTALAAGAARALAARFALDRRNRGRARPHPGRGLSAAGRARSLRDDARRQCARLLGRRRRLPCAAGPHPGARRPLRRAQRRAG